MAHHLLKSASNNSSAGRHAVEAYLASAPQAQYGFLLKKCQTKWKPDPHRMKPSRVFLRSVNRFMFSPIFFQSAMYGMLKGMSHPNIATPGEALSTVW
jgi:hypothetical protein